LIFGPNTSHRFKEGRKSGENWGEDTQSSLLKVKVRGWPTEFPVSASS